MLCFEDFKDEIDVEDGFEYYVSEHLLYRDYEIKKKRHKRVWTPLTFWCLFRNMRKVNALLAAGADPNERTVSVVPVVRGICMVESHTVVCVCVCVCVLNYA